MGLQGFLWTAIILIVVMGVLMICCLAYALEEWPRIADGANDLAAAVIIWFTRKR